MINNDNVSEVLRDRWASLQQHWTNTREQWNDPVAMRFEREFWSEWENALPKAIDLMRELEKALTQANREAYDENE